MRLKSKNKISPESKTIPPDPGGTIPFYQCFKMSLKSVVRDDTVIAKLQDAALRANGIMIHTLQLLKLYLIHCYDTENPFPSIDRPFVTSVMKARTVASFSCI